MPLRSPVYLDVDTLLSQAEYNDVEVPRREEVVASTKKRRGGGGHVGFSGLGVDASVDSDVEYQSSYSLEPSQKATISKVIDALQLGGHVESELNPQSVLHLDQLVEIEGRTRMTGVSLAGKVFYVLRRYLGEAGVDLLGSDSSFDASDADLVDALGKVYLKNELVPVPVLLELLNSPLACKAYVSLQPEFCVNAASVSNVVGEFRVLGTVRHVIDGGNDGYLSSEKWLLHDWEYLMGRHLMVNIDTMVDDLVTKLEPETSTDEVHTYLKGPAVVIDAIGLY